MASRCVELSISRPSIEVEDFDRLPQNIGRLITEIILKLDDLKEDDISEARRKSLFQKVNSFVSSCLLEIEKSKYLDQKNAVERVALKTLKRFKKGLEGGIFFPWYGTESSFPEVFLENPAVLKRCVLSQDIRNQILYQWGEKLKKQLGLITWPKKKMAEQEFIKKTGQYTTREIFYFPPETGIPLIALQSNGCRLRKIDIQGREFEIKDERCFYYLEQFLSYFLNGNEIEPTLLDESKRAFDKSFWASNWRISSTAAVYKHLDRLICEYLSRLIASNQLYHPDESPCILELFGGKGDLAKKILDLYTGIEYIFSEYDPVSLSEAQERLSGKPAKITSPTNALTADYQEMLSSKLPSVIIISGGLTGCVLNNKDEAMTVLKKLYPFIKGSCKLILTGLAFPWLRREDLEKIGFRCLNLYHSSSKNISEKRPNWFFVVEKIPEEKDLKLPVINNSLDLFYFFQKNKSSDRIEKLQAIYSPEEMSKVESLDLGFTDITPDEMNKLFLVAPNLKHLNISGTDLLTSISGDILFKLESLSLCQNSYDYKEIRSIVETSPAIRSIKMDYSNKLTPEQIVEIYMLVEMRKDTLSFDFLENNLYDKKLFAPLICMYIADHSFELKFRRINLTIFKDILTKEDFMRVFLSLDLRKTVLLNTCSESLENLCDFIAGHKDYFRYEQEKPYLPSVEELKKLMEEKYSDLLQNGSMRELEDILIFNSD